MAKQSAKPAKKAAGKSSSKAPKVSGDSILAQYTSIQEHTKDMEEDVRKLVDEGVKASAKRLRSHAQDIKKLCASIRKDTMIYVKSLRNKG